MSIHRDLSMPKYLYPMTRRRWWEPSIWITGACTVADVEKDFQETLEQCMEVDMRYYKRINILNRLMGRVLRLVGPLT